jgi:hypothetical protein
VLWVNGQSFYPLKEFFEFFLDRRANSTGGHRKRISLYGRLL